MKKAMILALALLLNSFAYAGDIMGKHGEAIGLSYVGTFIVTGVYASTGPGMALLVGASTVSSVTMKEIEARKSAAKLLLNDVQDFFQSGSMSINLQSAVKAVRAEDSTLSEAEALDVLNSAALLLLEE